MFINVLYFSRTIFKIFITINQLFTYSSQLFLIFLNFLFYLCNVKTFSKKENENKSKYKGNKKNKIMKYQIIKADPKTNSFILEVNDKVTLSTYRLFCGDKACFNEVANEKRKSYAMEVLKFYFKHANNKELQLLKSKLI
jgi:hypothetical protein